MKWRTTGWWRNREAEMIAKDPTNMRKWKHIWGFPQQRSGVGHTFCEMEWWWRRMVHKAPRRKDTQVWQRGNGADEQNVW